MYMVCIQNAKNTRELQRSEIYWLYYVFDMYRMAGIFANLFWDKQRLQGIETAIVEFTRNVVIRNYITLFTFVNYRFK